MNDETKIEFKDLLAMIIGCGLVLIPYIAIGVVCIGVLMCLFALL